MDLTIYPLLNFAVCNPVAVGIGTFAQGAFGAIGASRQAAARNRARIQNYEHQLKVRKHQWYQQLSIWGAQRNKYYTDLNENDLAAQRGYSQAQVGLNRVWESAAQNNESQLIKYLQSSGKLAAMGRTGKSISRIAALDLGALERAQSKNFYRLTKSKESYKANVENIRNQQMSHRNRLQARVAFAPMPDLAPPPPQMENQSPGMGLLLAGLGGAMAYGQAKLPPIGGTPGDSQSTDTAADSTPPSRWRTEGDPLYGDYTPGLNLYGVK